MVNMKTHPIRHILTAYLTCIIIPLHDLLTKFFGHKPALILTMIIPQITLIIDFLQLCVTVFQPRIITKEILSYHINRIWHPNIILLLIPSLASHKIKPKRVFIICQSLILLHSPILQQRRPVNNSLTCIVPIQNLAILLRNWVKSLRNQIIINTRLHPRHPPARNIKHLLKIRIRSIWTFKLPT